MNHDVIEDRYARLYELPRYLAENNHEVSGHCLSYHERFNTKRDHSTKNGKLNWQSWHTGFLGMLLPIRLIQIYFRIKSINPDIIFASSDQIHIIIGAISSYFLNKKFSVDLYDNFEAQGLGEIPGLNMVFRIALRRANLITNITPALRDHLSSDKKIKATLKVLLSTIDFGLFKQRDKIECRKEFSLDETRLYVGTAGNLRKKMGIATVFDTIKSMAKSHPNITFLLAGDFDENFPPPKSDNVKFIGRIPFQRVASFISCLDVALIYQSNNSYGRYAFPQKAFEIAACQIPIVAANVGSIPEIFNDLGPYLYEPGDEESLENCIVKQLEFKKITRVKIDDWSTQGRKLSEWLSEI